MHGTCLFLVDLVAQTLDSNLVKLRPNSILGVFWLQSHFPEHEWETLINGQAAFELHCMHLLADDARAAGIKVEWSTSTAQS